MRDYEKRISWQEAAQPDPVFGTTFALTVVLQTKWFLILQAVLRDPSKDNVQQQLYRTFLQMRNSWTPLPVTHFFTKKQRKSAPQTHLIPCYSTLCIQTLY